MFVPKNSSRLRIYKGGERTTTQHIDSHVLSQELLDKSHLSNFISCSFPVDQVDTFSLLNTQWIKHICQTRVVGVCVCLCVLLVDVYRVYVRLFIYHQCVVYSVCRTGQQTIVGDLHADGMSFVILYYY